MLRKEKLIFIWTWLGKIYYNYSTRTYCQEHWEHNTILFTSFSFMIVFFWSKVFQVKNLITVENLWKWASILEEGFAHIKVTNKYNIPLCLWVFSIKRKLKLQDNTMPAVNFLFRILWKHFAFNYKRICLLKYICQACCHKI